MNPEETARTMAQAMTAVPARLPLPDAGVTIRPATAGDVAFIDGLQKKHSKQLGFMRNSWIEAKIAGGQVLIAEAIVDRGGLMVEGEASSQPTTLDDQPSHTPVGYVISTDRYFKRDDCGIVYQMCVSPEARRGLIAATLLKAVFDRAAYGCRLYCCWCAQDLEANRFWEAMGFVPLAYRAGSEKKIKGGRVHIFWQKRIREGDRATPWWFPAKTDAGSLRADRIVLPIPPGVRWRIRCRCYFPPTWRGRPARVWVQKKSRAAPPRHAGGRWRSPPSVNSAGRWTSR